MTTGYPGRLADHDLGLGHSCTFGEPGTLTWSHLYGPSGGWHSTAVLLAGTGLLAAGSPGAEDRITVAAQLTCPLCGITGRITAGRWQPA